MPEVTNGYGMPDGTVTRYTAWDGTQAVPAPDGADILEALANDALGNGDLDAALGELARRGFETAEGEHVPGADELLREVEERIDNDGRALPEMGEQPGAGGDPDRHPQQRTLDEILDREITALDELRARADHRPAGAEAGGEAGAENGDGAPAGAEAGGEAGAENGDGAPAGAEAGGEAGAENGDGVPAGAEAGGEAGAENGAGAPAGAEAGGEAGAENGAGVPAGAEAGGEAGAENGAGVPAGAEAGGEAGAENGAGAAAGAEAGGEAGAENGAGAAAGAEAGGEAGAENGAGAAGGAEAGGEAGAENGDGAAAGAEAGGAGGGQPADGDLQAAIDRAAFLEMLPGDFGDRMEVLELYPFLDAQAQREFDQLLEALDGDAGGAEQAAGAANGGGDHQQAGADEHGDAQGAPAGDVAALEALRADLRQFGDGAMRAIDVEDIRQLLGEPQAAIAEQVNGLRDRLLEAGAARDDGGRLELTARGIRMIGQRALAEIFNRMKFREPGNHGVEEPGRHGERLEDTKPLEFGDPFQLHMGRTIMNAVRRNGPSTPVRLTPDDFEVHRSARLTSTATLLALDRSWSMALSGSFQAGKRVALALHSLIAMQYPRDDLTVLGFAGAARVIHARDIATCGWEESEIGTNFQHVLATARRRLSARREGTRQIVLITDGAPNSWVDDAGQRHYAGRLSETVRQELRREVGRCTRTGIEINIFMMSPDPELQEVAEEMARLNGGRVFTAPPGRLGEYLLSDYVQHKRKRLARAA